MINFGTSHTFTARQVADGFTMRPRDPPHPGYRKHVLPDGRRVFVDPMLPECLDAGFIAQVAIFQVPAELMADEILV